MISFIIPYAEITKSKNFDVRIAIVRDLNSNGIFEKNDLVSLKIFQMNIFISHFIHF